MKWLPVLFLAMCANAQTTMVIITNRTIEGPCPWTTNYTCPRWEFTNSVHVAPNQVIHILNQVGSSCQGGNYPLVEGFDFEEAKMYIPNTRLPLTIAGPATIHQVGCGFLTYKITSKEEPIQPGTGVVIPTDATGPVEIVMESSADLVNWTAALPGTYGGNTTNRFFRVRAVRH